MATLKMRYGGNVISLPEGANFSPGNYGRARLKYRVNSSSVGELGLTTNTDAKSYCGLQMRVGGQICFIGRVSTTSYVSGDNVDYHGSSIGSRSQVVSTISEYLTSLSTQPIDYHSSSMSTSTSMYTEVTSTQKVETRSYTQEVWTASATGTINSGSGNGTSAAQPSLRTLTNNTGSTVTSRTRQNNVLTNSSYKATCKYSNCYSTDRFATNSGWNHFGAGATGTVQLAKIRVTGRLTYSNTVESWNHKFTASTQYGNVVTDQVNTVNITITSTTRLINSSVSSNDINQATNKQTGRTTYSSASFIAGARAAVKSTTSYYTSKTIQYYGQNIGSTTYESYSTNWSYWWTSCKKVTYHYYRTDTIREYSTRSYTGTTYRSSITRSTTSVSETIHNMNV